uniref:J domain-containing protein n=1 Tax=Eucampia antarctica TaxID=49252 RepID=A0A7S2S209_9STRA|mmetsp:Transcript_29881/g.28760  ORF Transcript_29881/g.28760 Transcript_29881/m.28760 type:complete len:379 (+) Transcript_29881:117-1253(+)|eukprot:CAMPEP_0197827864 /NCGR_PEP_ID=MMETSP1437-20131217/4553_1 /TAXON_ID=49252 ORGANISM="Eucampia antarctica, Strain CCMP1452" /NCGR_SAMPLE_ID=MMETSP1437 /ASSEMBLY_ACC=CAM_ASM_001096 /LENGTH=378 /DNA_ID=CAMNT_0043428873 /DNA_START=117 /DNA_END=1253 /DNA_ORIENTATION=+
MSNGAPSTTPSVSRASSFSDTSTTGALHQLLSPDGYYTYLNIPHNVNKKATASSFMGSSSSKEEDEAKNSDEIDMELVKKNYRRLSLRHHPDRRGGDAETFRVLTRAKRVLMVPKLRKEYDLLGLDLDDEEGNEDHQESATASDSDNKKNNKNDADNNKEDSDNGNSTTETVMSHLASATLATILQAAVRTAMMTIASTLICRFKYLVIPAILFLGFVFYRVMKTSKAKNIPTMIGTYEKVSPLCISMGLFLMYYGRSFPDKPWSWTFWLGETIVMTFFFLNSVPKFNVFLAGCLLLVSIIITLILRGKFWRYAFILSIEAGLAFIAVLGFPIMEMIFEELMNEKLRKIGDKIRAQSKQVEALYNQKQQQLKVEQDLD